MMRKRGKNDEKMFSACYVNDYLWKLETTNRADGNGAVGTGFRLQDYIYNANGQTKYVGYRWYCRYSYDSDFAYYNGSSMAYYAHTYNMTEINSITFGVSTEAAGVDIEFSNNSKSFKALSAAETLF